METRILTAFLGSLYGLLSGRDNVIILPGHQDFQVNQVAVLKRDYEIETSYNGSAILSSMLVDVSAVSYKKLGDVTEEEFFAAGLVNGNLASNQQSIRDTHHIDSDSEVTVVKIRLHLREGRCLVTFDVAD